MAPAQGGPLFFTFSWPQTRLCLLRLLEMGQRRSRHQRASSTETSTQAGGSLQTFLMQSHTSSNGRSTKRKIHRRVKQLLYLNEASGNEDHEVLKATASIFTVLNPAAAFSSFNQRKNWVNATVAIWMFLKRKWLGAIGAASSFSLIFRIQTLKWGKDKTAFFKRGSSKPRSTVQNRQSSDHMRVSVII